jgi:hypothetical protein
MDRAGALLMVGKVVLITGGIRGIGGRGLTYLVPFIERLVSVDMRKSPRTGDRRSMLEAVPSVNGVGIR